MTTAFFVDVADAVAVDFAVGFAEIVGFGVGDFVAAIAPGEISINAIRQAKNFLNRVTT
jgi:hypothetical protein